MNKVYLLIIAGCIAIPSVSVASDYGLGVSIKSSDVSVYIPVRVNESLFVEPYFRYSIFDSSEFGVSTGREDSSTTYDFGVGLFKVLNSINGLSPYYGTRIGYLSSENDNQNRFTTGDWEYKSTLRGFIISPALGVKYSFHENISIGFEAEWFYRDLDGDTVTNSNGTVTISDRSQTSSGTNTKIIIRYFY